MPAGLATPGTGARSFTMLQRLGSMGLTRLGSGVAGLRQRSMQSGWGQFWTGRGSDVPAAASARSVATMVSCGGGDACPLLEGGVPGRMLLPHTGSWCQCNCSGLLTAHG